jgi:general secretion pathway protein G
MESTTQKQDKGFTLVELLIVIVILGILATVTVFAVRGITDKGQENSCDVEKRSIETAFEAYYAAEGSDAADISALVPGYLKTDPSPDRWTSATNPAGGAPILSPAGKCVPTP